MFNFRKTLGSIALSSVLAFSGTSVGIATAAPTTGFAGAVVDATMEPQVALVWNVWQDNFYSKETCKRASFAVLGMHGYIRDYDCLQNRPGTFNAGISKEALAELNGTPDQPRSFDRLDELLNRQHYRLAYWRVAADEINYRRFFDVNELAALCMERLDVFQETHELILHWLGDMFDPALEGYWGSRNLDEEIVAGRTTFPDQFDGGQ